MSYDLFIKRRLDEIEEKLLSYQDPIERLHIWFMFIKEFNAEAHALLDTQYIELIQLCKAYTATPDMVARGEIRRQVVACSKEIENLNNQLKRVPRFQARLEKDVASLEGE